MVSVRVVLACMLSIAATSHSVLRSSCGSDEPAAPLKVATKRASDQVTWANREKQLVVEVRSATGIGEATLERTGDRWPDSIVLKLHLKGLESLRIERDQHALNLAVSSTKPYAVRRWRDAREEDELKRGSPWWCDVERREAKGAFEVRLPRALFEGNPQAIKLKWIDFYRN